jgi:glycosyltransferase involved in cell wall biosynthesis
VEAAAHKKAAILIKDSCSAEEVIDDVNGFLCEENELSLADRICSLCDDPEKTKVVGENAYNTIYKTWQDVAREVLEKYQTIIAEKKAGLLEPIKVSRRKLRIRKAKQ